MVLTRTNYTEMDSMEGPLLRDIILNARKPLVFRKFSPSWKCFDCSIEEWCKKLDAVLEFEERAEFEQMPLKFGDSPQWERYRSKIGIRFVDFLDVHSKDVEKWTAFNYKRSEDMPLECRYDIDFSCFGFAHAAKDASIWLGSKGSNTPCHFDTYGCNIVVQVYGKKNWLLFPPEAQLTPIRVPYEESSVYCSENFFSPKSHESLSVVRQNAYECTLDEGDILIVPRNWWHYVESLETSLSVNAWIPLDIDINAQIEECIVKYIVERIVGGESEKNKQYILNPNQLELITSSEELFNILRVLLENTSFPGKIMSSEVNCGKYPYEYLSQTAVSNLIEKCNHDANVVKLLHPSEFDNIIHAKVKRYIEMNSPDVLQIDPIQETLLNAICHPNVIKIIKEKFLKTYSSNI